MQRASAPVLLPIINSPQRLFEQEKDFSARQYRGAREHQEDYYAFADVSPENGEPLSEILLVIGDGMGAHSGGSIASYITVNSFVKAYGEIDSKTTVRMAKALDISNKLIGNITMHMPDVGAPMGTTLMALHLKRNTIQWLSVGDSPLFLFRNGEIRQINDDHSMAPILEERVRRGEMTASAAASHPERHALQSAVMGEELTLVDLKSEPFTLQSGDILIGASDGIMSLTNEALREILTFGKNTPADKIADSIIFSIRLIDHPHQDNTTVAVIKIP
jgi:serine/threonine protein phosphatase PrpC